MIFDIFILNCHISRFIFFSMQESESVLLSTIMFINEKSITNRGEEYENTEIKLYVKTLLRYWSIKRFR